MYEIVEMEDKDRKNAALIVVYEADGRSASAIRLQSDFSPRQIALFSSGQFLIAGIKYSRPGSTAPDGQQKEETKRTAFTGIFDSRGRLLQELVLPEDVQLQTAPDRNNPASYPGSAIYLGRAVTGEDGNIYLLRNTAKPIVYVISPTGEVVRRFQVTPPSDKSGPPAMKLAAGRLVFDFFEPPPPGSRRMQLVLYLVDAQTGEKLWEYELPPAVAGAFACYNGRDFIFLTMTEDRHLALLRATPH